MSMFRPLSSRALVCVAAVAAFGLVAVFPAAAVALEGAQLSRTVYGYGTVRVVDSSPPPDCTSPQSTGGGTEANVNGGSALSCINEAGPYEQCQTFTFPGGSESTCRLTVEAKVPDPAGWRFDHWSGDCSGSTASCSIVTSHSECEELRRPPCRTTSSGDVSAVAHFVDTRAPLTSFTQLPGGAVVYSDTRSQQFEFHTNEDGEAPTYQCRKDSGPFTTCSSGFTWSSIADGIHEFHVRATDASGLTGGDGFVRWEQETNPTATIVDKPASTSSTPDASFTYSSNKASHPADGSTLSYLCALDGASLSACPASGKSYSMLANGQHTFRVEVVFHGALEPSGQARTALATYTWTQADTRGPEVTLEESPDGTTVVSDSREASVSWTGDEPNENQTFECNLDDDPSSFQPCESPVTLTGLGDGMHDFRIRGRDFLGNVGAVRVVHWDQEVPPTVALTAGPAEGAVLTTGQASFSFSSNKGAAAFECELDGGGFAPCANPHSVSVGDGQHKLAVRAKVTSTVDGTTLTSSVASRSWSVVLPKLVCARAGASGCVQPPSASLAVAARVVRVKKGRAQVRLSCPGPGSCGGTAVLSAAKRRKSHSSRHGRRRPARARRIFVIGRFPFSLAPGAKGMATVRLKASARRALARAGRKGLKAKLAGSGVRARTVVLKPAKRRR
jgi:hypothetical protein